MTTRKRPEKPAKPEESTDDTNLGYADDAGHPGGLPDLEHKTETERDHDDD